MDNSHQQLIEKINQSNNILVTVSRNPSIDQLAACIGLTLILNALNKHATAVFSGKTPSTIEFLRPEGTLEKNTDSLRDFIIALDKNKADKLRYKLDEELNQVRIFITPYKTSITQNDLEFSQGDFNIDLVIALGVKEQTDLDDAIIAHGRILHDATVSSINVTTGGGLGSLNWHEPKASSLCELIVNLAQGLGQDLLDKQISTALLTGIVAETERFSNVKTSPITMSASAILLSRGADQQLVATKLQQPVDENNLDQLELTAADADSKKNKKSGNEKKLAAIKTNGEEAKKESDDGSLSISHKQMVEADNDDLNNLKVAQNENNLETDNGPKIDSQDLPILEDNEDNKTEENKKDNDTVEENDSVTDNNLLTESLVGGSKIVTEPPLLSGTFTANSQREPLEPALDPLGQPKSNPPLLNRESDIHGQGLGQSSFLNDPEKPQKIFTPPPDNWQVNDQSIEQHEEQQPLARDINEISSPSIELPEVGIKDDYDNVYTNKPVDNIAQPDETLQQLEEAVKQSTPQSTTSNIVSESDTSSEDEIRREINLAYVDAPMPAEPTQALNSLPLGEEINHDQQNKGQFSEASQLVAPTIDNPASIPALSLPPLGAEETAVPPVPPPIPFDFSNDNPNT